jgi:ParB-like chromosome segregation protein Spo0J
MNTQLNDNGPKQLALDRASSGTPVKLKLTEIESNGPQTRARINDETVNTYADRMTENEAFPPLRVYLAENGYRVADGYHRLAAARKCGFRDIDAIVERGTEQDALWYALGANREHGLRLSRADVRCAIALALKIFPERSSREIAKQIGCDHKTVEAARRKCESGGEIPQVNERVGADGKNYPVHTNQEIGGELVETPGAVERAEDDLPALAVESQSKPVGLSKARQALEVLRSIPDDDAERPQAVALVAQWIEAPKIMVANRECDSEKENYDLTA